jgi:hypothetical protein
MSEILEIFGEMVKVVASNPASILIVLGFFAILTGVFLPIGIGIQILVGGLGIFMMIAGIAVHVLWLQS